MLNKKRDCIGYLADKRISMEQEISEENIINYTNAKESFLELLILDKGYNKEKLKEDFDCEVKRMLIGETQYELNLLGLVNRYVEKNE